MSKYQQFLHANRPKLLGYFLLTKVSNDSGMLEAPYPPSMLTEEQLDALKDQLRECMPLDSMIIDLWDWDVHFEACLSEDWYFETVFGDETCVETCSEELAAFFLAKVDEYGMDYNQIDDDPEFADLVHVEARKFIVRWRERVAETYAQHGDAGDAPQEVRP